MPYAGEKEQMLALQAVDYFSLWCLFYGVLGYLTTRVEQKKIWQVAATKSLLGWEIIYVLTAGDDGRITIFLVVLWGVLSIFFF